MACSECIVADGCEGDEDDEDGEKDGEFRLWPVVIGRSELRYKRQAIQCDYWWLPRAPHVAYASALTALRRPARLRTEESTPIRLSATRLQALY